MDTYTPAPLVLPDAVNIFYREGYVALFHAHTLKKAYGDDSVAKALESLKQSGGTLQHLSELHQNILQQLHTHGFLSDTHTSNPSLDALQRTVGKINISNLVLLVSNDCDFDCSYCQIEQNIPVSHRVHMPLQVAQKALAVFEANTSHTSSKTITLTGGEPLLNLAVVKTVIKQVRSQTTPTRLVLFTNGAHVTKDIAKWLSENNVMVIVSIDGPAHVHNQARYSAQGQGTFEQVLKGYQTLREAGCEVGISAVCGSHVAEHLDETLDFFIQLKPKSLGFNLTHVLLNHPNPLAYPLSKFASLLQKAHETLKQHGIFCENITRAMRAFASESPRLFECQAQGRGMTVDARGKIGPCKSLLVPDIFSAELHSIASLHDLPMFKQWAHRSPVVFPECEPCSAIALCGGGCAYDSYGTKRSIEKPDTRICAFQHAMLKYLIWELFSALKNRLAPNQVLFPNPQEQHNALLGHLNSSHSLHRSVGHE